MYEVHFGLGGVPFQIAPDLHFYVDTDAHRSALADLQAGLARGEEFIALTGDFGSGKTMVARRLVKLVDRDRYAIVELAGWRIEGDDVLTRMAGALGRGDIDTALPLGTLMQRLQEIARKDRATLLVIDEAHLLGLAAVRRLAKLTAMRADGRGLLHVCLVGRSISPAFDEHLRVGRALPIDTLVQLAPLDATATDVYIRGRLEHVGWKGHPSFAAGATAEIHARTAGNPARINRLCGHLLAWLCECGEDVVTVELARSVAARLQSEFDDLAVDADADPRPPLIAGRTTAHAPVPSSPRDPAPEAALRNPPASEALQGPLAQATGTVADPLLDIGSMLQDAIAEARAEVGDRVPRTPYAVARVAPNRQASLARPLAPVRKSNTATNWKRVLQTAAVTLAFGGGFIAWQQERVPKLSATQLGRIATSTGKPSPDLAAAPQRSAALAAGLPASSTPQLADAALSLELAPPAAGGRTIAPSAQAPGTAAVRAADATAAVAGTTPPAMLARPSSVAAAGRPRHRLPAHVAGNGAGAARAQAAVVACSLEAQTMGLCRLARPREPAREPAPGAVPPPLPAPAPSPPPHAACSAAQSALGLCNP